MFCKQSIAYKVHQPDVSIAKKIPRLRTSTAVQPPSRRCYIDRNTPNTTIFSLDLRPLVYSVCSVSVRRRIEPTDLTYDTLGGDVRTEHKSHRQHTCLSHDGGCGGYFERINNDITILIIPWKPFAADQ